MKPFVAYKKGFALVWRCYQLLAGFLAKGYLPRALGQSCLSGNVKSDNEVNLRAVNRSFDKLDNFARKIMFNNRHASLVQTIIPFCDLVIG